MKLNIYVVRTFILQHLNSFFHWMPIKIEVLNTNKSYNQRYMETMKLCSIHTQQRRCYQTMKLKKKTIFSTTITTYLVTLIIFQVQLSITLFYLRHIKRKIRCYTQLKNYTLYMLTQSYYLSFIFCFHQLLSCFSQIS